MPASSARQILTQGENSRTDNPLDTSELPVIQLIPAAAAPAHRAVKRGMWFFLVVLLLAALAACTNLPATQPPADLLPTTASSPGEAPGASPTPALTPTSAEELAPTPAPSPTAALAATPEPTAAQPPELPATPEAPAAHALGGADQIAFFSGSDVWTAGVDGSGLTQLTTGATAKKYLRWLPDGAGLTYISGTCLHAVSLAGEVETLTCFNSAHEFDSFEVSPDGQQVALSLDRQLYLLPFNLDALRSAGTPGDLQAMATCPGLAPYQAITVRYVRWSGDSKRLAAVVTGKLKNGKPGDVIQVFPVDECLPDPLISVRFPDQHFTYIDYNRNPTLQDFAWDGGDLFILHSHTPNQVFSALHMFNTGTFEFTESINPVDGACCYRDPQFSPDGSYLVFAFHDYSAGASSGTRLYYIPFDSIGSGALYQPLPIPDITDPLEQPQPALRPAP